MQIIKLATLLSIGRFSARLYPCDLREEAGDTLKFPVERGGGQESQTLSELTLSVPNCIYWPCPAPPNPGL